ncbi:hypothetical protein [Streptomyces endophytica]|uniref:Uncharacterized protein n=1 Tax=Streptomyces endophytica TaxID=2991496 RepID=A0ABY6P8B6_9ACTN|nr:hypothetical protein [Streptomyces endophytica]UZJ29487.1 hypothetical protein OJ254_02065 [Streptomyces endophytica]
MVGPAPVTVTVVVVNVGVRDPGERAGGVPHDGEPPRPASWREASSQ